MSFALFLFASVLVSGLIWLIDALFLKKRRAAGVHEPMWIEYAKSFFPVLLIVFTLRSFIVEPFKIPSGSMIPTLLVGDFILVNKFIYGVRLPIINKKIMPLNTPQRGDVMVFRYPVDPSVDYIKRVVGVPGDKVTVRNDRISINGVPVPVMKAEDFYDREKAQYYSRYVETLGKIEHPVLIDAAAPPVINHFLRFPFAENCSYNTESVTCAVPEGHYFMMGDNRDNSADSRVWGFVPDRNIVGKAFFIWFNFSELRRFGSFH